MREPMRVLSMSKIRATRSEEITVELYDARPRPATDADGPPRIAGPDGSQLQRASLTQP